MGTSYVLLEAALTDSGRATAAYLSSAELRRERLPLPEWWRSLTSFQTRFRVTSILSCTPLLRVHLPRSTTLHRAAIRCLARRELPIVLQAVRLVILRAWAMTRHLGLGPWILPTCCPRG